LAGFALAASLAAQSSAALHGESTAQAAASRSGATLESGTQLNATLKSTLDARRAHVGDSVTAVTRHEVRSGGRVLLPKGSRLIGRVTAVEAAGRGQAASQIGVLFDHAVTPHGSSMPLQAGIAAVLSSSMQADDTMGDMGSMGGMEMPQPQPAAGSESGGGLLGGVTGTLHGAVQGTVGGLGRAGGAVVENAARGTVAVAGGAAGMARDSSGHLLAIELPASGSAAAQQGSVLRAQRGNLHLNSGTDVTLVTTASTPVADLQSSSHAHARGSVAH